MLTALILTGLVVVIWVACWRINLPDTPAELFQERCSSCHELRSDKLCDFAPHLRATIVDTMRHLHGADKVISEDEARVIRRYLEESLSCP